MTDEEAAARLAQYREKRDHWHARALDAEAKVERMRQALVFVAGRPDGFMSWAECWEWIDGAAAQAKAVLDDGKGGR